jgi:predicted membrane protein
MFSAAGILLVLAALAVIWPRLLTVPFAVLSSWVAAALIFRACRLRLTGHAERAEGARNRTGKDGPSP